MEKKKEYKTPKYTRDAIEAYRKKNKLVQFAIPLEVAERMAAAGIDNACIKSLIMEELEKREHITDEKTD